MFRPDIEATLKLLALTILIDKLVLQEEIEAFMDSAPALNRVSGSTVKISAPRLLYWFELNRDDIAQMTKLDRAEFQRQFRQLICEASAFPDKFLIFKLMNKISVSDGRIHVSERALSKYAQVELSQVA